MKSLLNKLIVASLLLVSTSLFGASQIVSTYTTNEVRLLGTNPAYIADITLSAGATAVNFDLFDASTAVTNYVTAAYVTRSQTLSNVVSSYVTTTGITNVQTNTVLYTTTVTNAAATNALPYTRFSLQANQTFTFSADLVNSRGIVGRADTNVIVTISYRRLF